MVNYTCSNCQRSFKQKSLLENHQNRKTPCKNTIVETKVDEHVENKDTIENHDLINHIANLDASSYLDSIPDRFVNTFVLDPPYYRVVDEEWDKQWKTFDDYLAWMDGLVQKMARVSKHSASVWLFGMAYQLGYLIPIFEKHGFTYRQHITIDKGMKSAAGRVSSKLKMFPTVTEYIVYFHKESRSIIKKYLQDKMKESNKTPLEINTALGKATNGGGKWSTIAGIRQQNIQYPTREDWDSLVPILNLDWKYDDYVFKFNLPSGLTDVWNDISFQEKGRIHPTQKPAVLIERIIKCSSEVGDIVLDPFMGSGQTARVCRRMGISYIGCELDKKYYEKLTDI